VESCFFLFLFQLSPILSLFLLILFVFFLFNLLQFGRNQELSLGIGDRGRKEGPAAWR